MSIPWPIGSGFNVRGLTFRAAAFAVWERENLADGVQCFAQGDFAPGEMRAQADQIHGGCLRRPGISRQRSSEFLTEFVHNSESSRVESTTWATIILSDDLEKNLMFSGEIGRSARSSRGLLFCGGRLIPIILYCVFGILRPN